MPQRQARPSTDEGNYYIYQSAPLLQDNLGNGGPHPSPAPSITDRLGSILQNPLTTLNKILLILLLVFLLLSSIFIGLFIGSQHKLNIEPGTPGGKHPPSTFTSIVTVPSITTATVTTTSVTTVTRAPAPGPSSPPEEASKECFTPECVVLSAAILSSLDTSQDPCENFYEYATGGWRKAHPLPSDKGRFGNFNLLFQENQQIVRDILNFNGSIAIASLKESADKQLLTKLRNLYYSCMDEDTLDQLGEGPLNDFVGRIQKLYRGQSTEIANAKGSNNQQEGLTAALAFLHSRGVPALFEFGVEGDAAVDPNFMILWFQQPRLGLPSKEYFEDQTMRKVYESVLEHLLSPHYGEEENRHMSQVLVNNEDAVNVWPPWPWPPWGDDDGDGDDSPEHRRKNATELAGEVVRFEWKLARASLDLDILYQDPLYTYNKVPISNITETVTQVNFPNYFATFTPRNYPTEVIVTYPAYTRSLTSILNDTDTDVLEAYLVTRAALALAPRLGTSTESWKAVRNLQEVLQGIKPGAVGDRAEYCVNSVDQALGFATGRYFVNETFAGDSKEKGTKVITDIVKAFKESLPHISWMDKDSAVAAAEKADAIRVKVGYPVSPNTLSSQSLLRYYALVKIGKFGYFNNMLSASASDVYKEWQQLGKRRDLDAWEMTPATVNAYFNPPANEIVFPAGILRPPFFNKDWPPYLNYGAFGQVASHELTHAFDSAGRLYNQEGKLEEWWTNATSERFKERQDCLERQYSAYTVEDGHGGKVHVNGNLTSGENIGDSGIIQAYRAWKAQYDDSFKAGNEYLLPGLNYTRDQLFFIAFGRIWAENIKPEALVQRVRTDPHSPAQFRVDGTLHNVPEFARAFNCSPRAKLNPPTEKRCLLW
ncbi:Metalloprotease [Multifurca ochricompacta]|uniref:Metalloprotease n=1 Tax=Multifurca ochricompacta TaxID=376703 RepID=A0AAD4MA18_9AGAM|nr:Metalloprotease [Multifurca ochricompacta]